jgi:hypothetical protein
MSSYFVFLLTQIHLADVMLVPLYDTRSCDYTDAGYNCDAACYSENALRFRGSSSHIEQEMANFSSNPPTPEP